MKKILKHKFEGKGDLRISIEITLGDTHVKRPSHIKRQFDVVVIISTAFERAAICVLRRSGLAQNWTLSATQRTFVTKTGLTITLYKVCT
jgi:hypothetical protein